MDHKDSPSALKGPAAAARARKRRIALRNKQAAAGSETIDGGSDKRARSSGSFASSSSDDGAREAAGTTTGKPKPSITGIKKQSRYIPGVPMTKEELKAWRKEARRVRNRESAAASRRRNRDLLKVLENQVDAMKTKYAAALRYIVDLEGSSNDPFLPQVLRQDLMEARDETSPLPSSNATPARSFSFGGPAPVPPLPALTEAEAHDRESIGNGGISPFYDYTPPPPTTTTQQLQHQQPPHIMNMIPRPTAACVS